MTGMAADAPPGDPPMTLQAIALPLQRIVFPAAAHADRTVLYARWPRGGVHLAAEDGSLRLADGATLDLGTFFNAFSHRKWHALTGLTHLAFSLSGSGTVRVRVLAMTRTAAAVRVLDRTVDLSAGDAALDLPDPSTLPGEILTVELAADSGPATLASAAFTTRQPPRRDVRLAAVITTFRR